MKKALRVLLFIVLLLVLVAVGGYAYLKLALPNVGKAPDMKIAGTPEQVAHGEYLANHVAVCMDCHSTRDWSRFSGPIADGTLGKGGELFDRRYGFPGSFYSKNITPFGIKDWSDGEIYRAVTAGVTKKGEPIFPIMPYHYYGSCATEDIQDIIAYIRTLQPIESHIPESKADFPVNLIMRTFPKKAAPHTRPSPADSVAYGGYLVNMSGCVECHTKADEKAKLIAGTEFGGGREFALPGGIVRSANITPDITGIGNWTEEAFIQRFKNYLKPENVAQGLKETDMNTVMPWIMYAGMTESDLASIYQYLKTLKPISNQPVHFQPKASL